MKKIVMVRHATAAPKGVDVDDFARSLRKKGHKECRAMIRWYLENVGEVPDLMLSSPANRAIETAELFANGLGYKPKRIAKNEALYGTAGPEAFLEILKSLDGKYSSVMVFGHDPVFSEFAKYMVDVFDDVLPKCSVFGFTVNRKSWKTLKAGDGRVEYFESPGVLQQQRIRAKQVRKAATERIEAGIWDALAEFGIDKTDVDTDGNAKVVRRASAGIAKSVAHRLRIPAGTTAPKKGDDVHSGEESAE